MGAGSQGKEDEVAVAVKVTVGGSLGLYVFEMPPLVVKEGGCQSMTPHTKLHASLIDSDALHTRLH